MTYKDSIRSRDRQKLNKYYQAVDNHFHLNFNSGPICNRCNEQFSLNQLEINHISYDEHWRFAELVCRPCHEAIDFKSLLPKFDEVKEKIPNNTILGFQRNFPGLVIMSKLSSGRISLTGRVKVLKEVKVPTPLGFFN